MGRSGKAKKLKNAEKVKCDGPTDGPTDGLTDRRTEPLIELLFAAKNKSINMPARTDKASYLIESMDAKVNKHASFSRIWVGRAVMW